MKQAINTRTQEEYDALMEYFAKKGQNWNGGGSLDGIPWKENKEKTCVLIDYYGRNELTLTSVDVVKNIRYFEIIPYTEFAKANIVEEKMKLTQKEAREYLTNSWILIPEGRYASATEKLKEIGFIEIGWKTKPDGVINISNTPKDHYWYFPSQNPVPEYEELNIETLLSIEIIEETDYRALYLEGRELLERIAKWQLPETGKFWDEERTRPTSYEAEYGSNGVRDYWKNQAQQFLTNHKDGE